MSHLNLNVVRREVLFASVLQISDDTAPARVRATVMETVRALGTAGCVARMAQEFGDHPDTAAARMEWAQAVISRVYGRDDVPARRLFARASMRLRPGTRVRESGFPAMMRLPA
jgi:hypothetical protein